MTAGRVLASSVTDLTDSRAFSATSSVLLVACEILGVRSWGVIVGDRVSVSADTVGAPATLTELVASESPHAWVERVSHGTVLRDIGTLRLLAPCVMPPPEILAFGMNYRDHLAESHRAARVSPRQSQPILFSKAPTSVIGPGAAIVIDESQSTQVDWEVELAIIVGKAGVDIPRSQALEHVLGYTVANDVSARDIQLANAGQWYLGKSFDTFCPMGPVLALGSSLDVEDLELTLHVNGTEKQRARTSEMVFGVAEAISFASRRHTLLSGTVILTGTPGGVGFTRTPPECLRSGDVVEAAIQGIGTLRNPVVSAAHSSLPVGASTVPMDQLIVDAGEAV